MNVYEEGMGVLETLFARDYQFALATSNDNIPSVRFIDTFYDSEAFYIVTYGTSQKVVRVDLKKGFFYKDGTGYKVDFDRKTAEKSPFLFDILTID